MILDVSDLEMVVAIHQTGTITAAAKSLYITQPALSRRLKTLEERLKARLFHREGPRMVATTEGNRVLRSAVPILRELRSTEHDVKQLAAGLDGIVRIATECHLCYHWLPNVVQQFRAAYPKVEIRIVPEATREPLAALEAGTLDVAIIYHTPAASSEMQLTKLFTDELVAVVNATHELADREYIQPDDFREVDLVCHYAEPDRSVLDRAVLQPAGIRPRSILELQVTPAVMEMVRAALGVTVIPRWILECEAARGLRAIPITPDGLFRTWYAAVFERSAGAAVHRFVDVLKQETRGAAEHREIDCDDGTERPLRAVRSESAA